MSADQRHTAERDARHPCCPHCADAASDHVEHGGTVEKDGHEIPCSTCEFDQRIRPQLAQAWDEGHRLAAPHGDRCEPTCPNPYRVTSPGVDQ